MLICPAIVNLIYQVIIQKLKTYLTGKFGSNESISIDFGSPTISIELWNFTQFPVHWLGFKFILFYCPEVFMLLSWTAFISNETDLLFITT